MCVCEYIYVYMYTITRNLGVALFTQVYRGKLHTCARSTDIQREMRTNSTEVPIWRTSSPSCITMSQDTKIYVIQNIFISESSPM